MQNYLLKLKKKKVLDCRFERIIILFVKRDLAKFGSLQQLQKRQFLFRKIRGGRMVYFWCLWERMLFQSLAFHIWFTNRLQFGSVNSKVDRYVALQKQIYAVVDWRGGDRVCIVDTFVSSYFSRLCIAFPVRFLSALFSLISLDSKSIALLHYSPVTRKM